jgi:hypothetical protein
MQPIYSKQLLIYPSTLLHLPQLFNLEKIIMQGAGSLSNRGNSHTLQDGGSVTSTQEFHKIEYTNPILFMHACKNDWCYNW